MEVPYDTHETADLPRHRNLRRSSMTGRVTGARRRDSMASQISQISGSTPDTSGVSTGAGRGRRRTRRRNSMLSNASRDSARSRASSQNIDRLAAEIKELEECKEHELALAEEEKRRLRLEQQQSFESAGMLEDLLETASMADGGFDVEAALRRHEQQRNNDGSSLGDIISIPVDVLIEDDLRGLEDSGKISAATFDPADYLVSYEEPVKGSDLDAYKTPYNNNGNRRGRGRRTARSGSPASDEEGSVCSVEKLDYAENKIERIQQARRSRSMSVDRAGTEAKRKPRRGRRLTRSSSRDPCGDSGASTVDGERRIRSRSLDVGGALPRHQRKRPTNSKSMRKAEVAAIADLQVRITERKADIEQTRGKMEMRIESAEENATMMDEIASMQIKTIADLKVEILKTKAALRFNAVRRRDSDAITAERKTDPKYRQALQEAEQSRQLLAELRGRIDEVIQEENQSNARQAELLRKIPQVRAEGVVADMKRMLEYNRTMDKISKEELASRQASIKCRIAKSNSSQASKAIDEGKYGAMDSSENHIELQKAFVSTRKEIQRMKEAVAADIESIKSLPKLRSKPTQIVQASDENTLLAEDATAAIERLGAEWREQYIYLRIIRGRDEEIHKYEEHIGRLNEEIARHQRLRSQKRKDAGKVKRAEKQLLPVGGSDDAKTTTVSTR